MRKRRRKKLQRYSSDWQAITLAKKLAANWTCQECGRVCLQSNSKLFSGWESSMVNFLSWINASI